MQKSIRKIGLAGSGNVAWHLAKGLTMRGYDISGVWSRNYDNALSLAGMCGSVVCSELSDLCSDSDLIIIAVADDAIENVARQIGHYDGIVVHTAGAVPLDVLKSSFENVGVLYPLQTFSKEVAINLDVVPFFLEASSPAVMEALKLLSGKLTVKVFEADSRQRLLLHAAAVFAGNYSNLMYIIGNELLASSKLPQEVLHPLILETATKAVKGDPLSLQTGPARRHDTSTIEKHIKALASLPDYAELYRLLADLLQKKYK